MKAETFGKIPPGWKIQAFGEVTRKVGEPVDVDPSVTYREIGIRSHGKGIFHKEPISGIELGDKRVFHVATEAFVLNIVFAWEGAVAKTSTNEAGMIASHRFPMFIPASNNKIDIDFLLRFFQSDIGIRLLGDASPGGAGRNRTLNQKFAQKIPIPIPPIGEQRKIAAILASVDETIEATQVVIEQLQVVKKAMMAELLTRGIPGRHKRFKKTELGEIPDEWRLCKVSEIGDVQYGLTVNQTRKRSSERLQYLTVANLKDEGIDLDGIKEIGSMPGDEAKYGLVAGDLLLIEGNASIDRLGRCFRWAGLDGLTRPILHQNHLIRVRLKETTPVAPKWLESYINSASVRLQIGTAAKTSSGLHTINSQVVKDLLVAIAPPSEQTVICSTLNACDERIATERSYLEGLQATKSALMSVLLTGEVRVTADGVSVGGQAAGGAAPAR